MRQGVDDGIVDGRGLRAENGQFGGEGRHEARVPPGADHADDCERRPGKSPQSDAQNGHLGRLDLGRLLVRVHAASQGRHVHLLGLLPQLVLVVENGSYNGTIATNDYDDGEHVLEEAAGSDVALVVPRCGVRIERAPITNK